MGRISIAGLIGFIAVFAIGLAALVNASFFWAGVVFTVSMGLLFTSVLAVILRGRRGGGWLGFAVFGWSALLCLSTMSGYGLSSYTWAMPDAAAEWIFLKSNPAPRPPSSPAVPPPAPVVTAPVLSIPPPSPDLLPPTDDWSRTLKLPEPSSTPPEASAFSMASEQHEERLTHAKNIGHWLWILVFGQVGSVLGIVLARSRRTDDETPPGPR